MEFDRGKMGNNNRILCLKILDIPVVAQPMLLRFCTGFLPFDQSWTLESLSLQPTFWTEPTEDRELGASTYVAFARPSGALFFP